LTCQNLITAQKPVHLSVFGGPSIFNSSGTLQGSTVATGFWYLKWSSFNSNNWSDTYTNGCRLAIPYTGIYNINFTYDNITTSVISFISKNLMNGADINDTSDKCLAISYNPGVINTISATTYLSTTDYINFGFYVFSGSGTPSYRCKATVTLIQKTA
jgi:hypothetical protein